MIQVEGKNFDKLSKLEQGTFEDCSFTNCTFSNQNFSGYSFINCTFERSDLSGVIVKDTSLKEVSFSHCKLLGVNFAELNPFLLQLSFNYCMLSYASFYQLKLPKISMKHCLLEEVDFAEAILPGAIFMKCDFKGAQFDQTNLEKADFSTSYNIVIDPNQNLIRKAKFSKENAFGLLSMFDIIIK